MAEPLARAAATDGLGLPLTLGGATLAAMPEAARVDRSRPIAGAEAAVGAALGGALPPPGAWTALGGGRVLWAGLGQWLVEGVDVAATSPSSRRSSTSRTPGRALALSGADAGDGAGAAGAGRSDRGAAAGGRGAHACCGTSPASSSRADAGFELLVLRSFAGSAVHDLAEAMRAASPDARR